MMPRYDSERPCAKCGFDRTEDRYHGARPLTVPSPIAVLLPCITRKCLRCEYVWQEAPLDMEVETDGNAQD